MPAATLDLATVQPPRRRALRDTAVATAIALAFVAGVVTGVADSGARPDRGPEPAAATAPSSATVLDEAADRIARRAARSVSRAALQRAAVLGMLQAVGDPWASYRPPSSARGAAAVRNGRYAGVGLWLRRAPAGVAVASVQPHSPAAQTRGVLAGDVIVAIDGRRVGRSVNGVAGHLRGAPGTAVQVTVSRAGRTRHVRLVRGEVGAGAVAVDRLDGGLMRVRIPVFDRGTARTVRAALASRPAAYRNGLVLDLRANPGGFLDEAVDVSSALLDGGAVVTYERRGAGPHTLRAAAGGDTTTPVVVLVDGGTASAAEVVAAALQDRGRAVLVGSRTFGKASVQEPGRLSDGSALDLTVGRYVTPGGRDLEGVGIEPDVLIAPTAPPMIAQRRAVEVLRGLVAALGTRGRG